MSENHGRGRGRREDASMGTQLTCFAIGATVGAVVALLFAPKSGRELRQDVADAARTGEYYETAASRAGELAASARDAASRRGELFGSAIEAGRQAYRDEKRRTESSALTEHEPPALEGENV